MLVRDSKKLLYNLATEKGDIAMMKIYLIKGAQVDCIYDYDYWWATPVVVCTAMKLQVPYT